MIKKYDILKARAIVGAGIGATISVVSRALYAFYWFCNHRGYYTDGYSLRGSGAWGFWIVLGTTLSFAGIFVALLWFFINLEKMINKIVRVWRIARHPLPKPPTPKPPAVGPFR